MNAERILVPIDFSEHSREALRLAISLASGNRNVQVTVLHVVEAVLPAFDQERGVLEPEVLKTKLETVAAAREQDVRVRSVVRYGEAGKAILDYANQEQSDLIVLGSHGRRSLLETLVGGTAEFVMRRAACPVLTVRSKQAKGDSIASPSVR